MTGNRRIGLVLQERDRQLLRELGTMRVVDCEQTRIVADFNSTRRANRRLLKLTRAGLLRRIFVGSTGHGQKALYTLSPKGAALVDAKLPGLPLRQSPFGTSPFLLHRLAINEIYLAVKHQHLPRPDMRCARWIGFREPLTHALPLIPDGYFELVADGATRPMFVEADLGTEALPVWQKKVQTYLQLALSGEFPKLFRQTQFRVLIVATTDRRLQHIRAAVAKQTDKIFWLSTFEQIHERGLWSPIWLRPEGEARAPLI
jgi:hypothetical protein